MTLRTSYALECSTPTCSVAYPATVTLVEGPPYALRAAATADGWDIRTAADICPACAPSAPARYALPRGICSACGRERALNVDGTIKAHPIKGRFSGTCLGSHHKPKRVAS